ncbi:hypothetical protein D3C87_1778040 [compost metagenome]
MLGADTESVLGLGTSGKIVDQLRLTGQRGMVGGVASHEECLVCRTMQDASGQGD